MKRTGAELAILQKLPLKTKELYFREKALEFIEYCHSNGKEPVLAFSGGLDSTVAGHMLRAIFPEIRFVFSNTGMEFNEIARFATSMTGTVVVRPRMNFGGVVEKYGFPAVSKKVSRQISDLQNPTDRNIASRNLWLTGYRKDGVFSPQARLSFKWRYLIDGPRLSNRCCDILKKEPLRRFKKENNALYLVGDRAEESKDRRDAWIKRGCNSFDTEDKQGHPMSIFTKQDVLAYIKNNNVPYCREIYGDIVEKNGQLQTTGESSTGCVGCLFGCSFDRLRYVRLFHIDPKKHKYCMDSGAAEVLMWLDMPAYCDGGPIENYIIERSIKQ